MIECSKQGKPFVIWPLDALKLLNELVFDKRKGPSNCIACQGMSRLSIIGWANNDLRSPGDFKI